MGNTIKLKIKRSDLKIEIEIPKDAELLHSILDRFTDYDDEELILREDAKSSKSLKRNNELKKVYEEYQKSYVDNYYQYTSIPNAELLDTEEKITFQTINKRALKDAIETAFVNVEKKNIQAIIIHISSSITGQEKNMLAEKILQELAIIPYEIIESNNKSKTTLVELFMFGQNIYESPFMKLFGG